MDQARKVLLKRARVRGGRRSAGRKATWAARQAKKEAASRQDAKAAAARALPPAAPMVDAAAEDYADVTEDDFTTDEETNSG